MNIFVATLALAVGTNAIITRWAPCCFHLDASGAVTGSVGQLSDGQARVGGGLPPSEFCIADSGITDSEGRGCFFTPPTTQFQCDVGASALAGFSIGCDGAVSYSGGTTFWECQTGDNGEANIYLTPGGANCGKITLKADGCFSGCAPPPHPPPPAKTCPTNLNDAYQFPHLIIPINSASPNVAAGTQFNGQVTSTISSIFNFDIPSSYSGETCSLVFLFPEQSQLVTSSYTFSGNGGIDFSMLSGVATEATDYANAPGVATDYGITKVAPGNSYCISTFPCPAGKAVSYELKASGDTSLWYFQDYNPSPIGLYITSC